MLVSSIFTFSLVATALALNVPREDSPSDQDLLSSCPGGPGSSNIKRADKCTLVNIVNNPDQRIFTVLGDPQLNCGGATDPIQVTLGGSTTVSTTFSVDANVGFDLDGLSIGGGASASTTTETTTSKEIQFQIPPGKQAVYVAGVAHTSQTGNVQVNYGSRQFGHFIWFTGAKITQLTPKSNDIVFDVHESDCGTDPRNLNSRRSVE